MTKRKGMATPSKTGMTARGATEIEQEALTPHVQKFTEAKVAQGEALKVVNHLVETFAGPGYVLNINGEGVWEFVPAPPEQPAQVIPMDIQQKIQEAADAAASDEE